MNSGLSARRPRPVTPKMKAVGNSLKRSFRRGMSSIEHCVTELAQETWGWGTLATVEGDMIWVEEAPQATASTSMERTTSTCSTKARAPTVQALETKAKGVSPAKQVAVWEAILTGRVTSEAEASMRDTWAREEAKAGAQASRSQILNKQINTSSRIQAGHHKQIQDHSNTTQARPLAKTQTKLACRTNSK